MEMILLAIPLFIICVFLAMIGKTLDKILDVLREIRGRLK
ncbi:hypothetical protein ES703_14458 [subsurface metagenome]